jgi:hypothetical protein
MYAVGKHKAFDKLLYEKYDVKARARVKAAFGDDVKDHDDKYAQDFIICNPKCGYKYLEIQVCRNWRDEKYPYESVSIFTRKSGYGNDTLFLTLNWDLTMGYLFDLRDVDMENPKRLKPRSREFIYEIPWRRCMRIYLHTIKDGFLAKMR